LGTFLGLPLDLHEALAYELDAVDFLRRTLNVHDETLRGRTTVKLNDRTPEGMLKTHVEAQTRGVSSGENAVRSALSRLRPLGFSAAFKIQDMIGQRSALGAGRPTTAGDRIRSTPGLVTSHCRLGLGTLVSAAQSAPGFGRCRDQGLVRSPGARGKSGIFGCATMATRGDARLPRVPRVQRPPILGVGPLKWLSFGLGLSSIMCVIALRAIKRLIESKSEYGDASKPALAWYWQVLGADWASPAIVKRDIRSASILKDGRVVFNIAGNKYQIVVWINFP
jgi:mRNA interferase HigB